MPTPGSFECAAAFVEWLAAEPRTTASGRGRPGLRREPFAAGPATAGPGDVAIGTTVSERVPSGSFGEVLADFELDEGVGWGVSDVAGGGAGTEDAGGRGHR